MRILFALVLTLSLFETDSHGLPASARLFQQQYGYKASCLLCHSSGGGSSVTPYGKAFLKAGANSLSFKKIESADSDGDEIANLKEILAKSNPGDKKSTPTQVGDWLANVTSVAIPQKELEKIFPGYSKFSAVEGSLNAKQIQFLSEKTKAPVLDDDKVPTFYFAEKDNRRVAVGQLLAIHSDANKTLTVGIAVSIDGKIINVIPIGGSLAKEADNESSLFQSYIGKSAQDYTQVNSKYLSHKAVERSLWLIQAVFGEGAKK